MSKNITKKIEKDTALPSTLKVVFEMWNALPRQPDLPLSSGFSLEYIPSKLLPWSVLVDVHDDPLDFQLRFWGTARTNLIGAEMTGKFLSDIASNAMREGNYEEYKEVCRNRQAVLCQTPILRRSGIYSTRTSMRLPLSRDGVHVSQIYSVIDPDTITQDHYDYYGTMPKKGL